jgi:hypothetical protein
MTTTATPAPLVASRRSLSVTSLSFAAVVACFFLTFLNVSCNGTRAASFSGVQLAVGTELKNKDMFGQEQTKKFEREPFAFFALIAAAGGLLLSLGGRITRTLTTVTGGAGAILLLLLKNKIDQDVLRQGNGLLTVEFAGAFYVAILLFAAAAILSYRANREPVP